MDPIGNAVLAVLYHPAEAGCAGPPLVAADDQRTEVALWHSLCAHVWHIQVGIGSLDPAVIPEDPIR
jgi:hypothetical protein